MIYAERVITKREPVNRFGRLGYVPYIQYFKTDKESFLANQNKGKKVRFESVKRDKKYMHIAKDTMIEERLER